MALGCISLTWSISCYSIDRSVRSNKFHASVTYFVYYKSLKLVSRLLCFNLSHLIDHTHIPVYTYMCGMDLDTRRFFNIQMSQMTRRKSNARAVIGNRIRTQGGRNVIYYYFKIRLDPIQLYCAQDLLIINTVLQNIDGISLPVHVHVSDFLWRQQLENYCPIPKSSCHMNTVTTLSKSPILALTGFCVLHLARINGLYIYIGTTSNIVTATFQLSLWHYNSSRVFIRWEEVDFQPCKIPLIRLYRVDWLTYVYTGGLLELVRVNKSFCCCWLQLLFRIYNRVTSARRTYNFFVKAGSQD